LRPPSQQQQEQQQEQEQEQEQQQQQQQQNHPRNATSSAARALFANDSACILFNVKCNSTATASCPILGIIRQRPLAAMRHAIILQPLVVKIEVIVGVFESAAQTAAQ
jgi:hypothetical protein